MNEDQARIIRLYQYLLSKEVYMKEQIISHEKAMRRKNPNADDTLALWLLLIKLECWQDFAGIYLVFRLFLFVSYRYLLSLLLFFRSYSL